MPLPFGLKLKRTRRYTVSSKSCLVTRIQLLNGEFVEFTLSVESTGQECLEAVAQRLELREVCVHFHAIQVLIVLSYGLVVNSPQRTRLSFLVTLLQQKPEETAQIISSHSFNYNLSDVMVKAGGAESGPNNAQASHLHAVASVTPVDLI